MVASYEEFAAEHRAQHLTAFNRWCGVVGNYSIVPTAVALLSGRPRLGTAVIGLGTAILLAGHAAEGNMPQSVRDFAEHPIWATRADFTLANTTVLNALKPPTNAIS
jgi:hypothetical protein